MLKLKAQIIVRTRISSFLNTLQAAHPIVASRNSAALMIRRRYRHKATARSVPPEHRTSSRSVLIASCEAHLVLTPGDILAEICWCLSHCDATQVAAATKVLKAALVDAGRQLRAGSELLLHESLVTGGLWCCLLRQEVATYLRAIAPLSVAAENNISIHQPSRCPPLLARRIH